MNGNNDKCDGTTTAMNIFLIFNIAFQVVIVVLGRGSNDPEKIKSKFFDKVQLLDEINKKCAEKFFEDLKDEKSYFDTVKIVVMVLSSISAVLAIILFIYGMSICCCETKFYSLSFIAPAYGMIAGVISMVLMIKERIECICNISVFDDRVNSAIIDEYEVDYFLLGIFSAVSAGLYILNLIFLLCLYCKKKKSNTIPNSTTVVAPVVPIQPIIPNSRPEIIGNRKKHKTYKSVSQASNSTSGKK